MNVAALERQAPSLPQVSTWQRVLGLVWPVLLQNWLIVTVHLSDRLLAGRFEQEAGLSTANLAAQTTAGYLSWILPSYTTLVSVGAAALVARLTGAGNRQGARQVVHQAIWLALFFGLVGTSLGLVCLGPTLAILQLHGTAAVQAAAYLRPLLYQLPLQMVCLVGLACLTGAGDTRPGLWVLGSVAICNVPLTWLCYHGLGPIPALGFPGIAIGTAVAQSLGGLAVLGLLIRGRSGLRLRLQEFWPREELMLRLLRISVPAAIDSLSMQVGYLCFLGIVNQLGEAAAAAHGNALAWESLGYQSGAAFGTAALAAVGQLLGAGRPLEARRAGWIAFAMGASVMCVMGAVFFTLAYPMFSLFSPHDQQAEVVALGVPVLRLVAFGMPGLAACLILARALQGAGDTRTPMLFTWLGFFVVRIPLALWLTGPTWQLGLFGAWLAMFADLNLRGACIAWRFAAGRWASIRV